MLVLGISLRMRRERLHFPAGNLRLIIAPRHLRALRVHAHHRDAFVHGADERAEITADAFVFLDLRDRFAGHATWAEAVTVRID